MECRRSTPVLSSLPLTPSLRPAVSAPMSRALSHSPCDVNHRAYTIAYCPCAPGPTDPVGKSYRLLTLCPAPLTLRLWARAGPGAQGQ